MWFGLCHLHLLAQVITGGHYDVDCYVEDPNGRTIYKETKKQYDSFPHRTEVQGVYTFCFSNEFSTFSHKTVYFDFQVGDEPPILPDMSNRVTALTQVSRCRGEGPCRSSRLRPNGPTGRRLGARPPSPPPNAEVPTASQPPCHVQATSSSQRRRRSGTGRAALGLNLPRPEHPVSIPHKGSAAKLFHPLL